MTQELDNYLFIDGEISKKYFKFIYILVGIIIIMGWIIWYLINNNNNNNNNNNQQLQNNNNQQLQNYNYPQLQKYNYPQLQKYNYPQLMTGANASEPQHNMIPQRNNYNNYPIIEQIY
jgi:4-amino-4-deoxy-L-arabinose transferase-like glycosyltransferase